MLGAMSPITMTAMDFDRTAALLAVYYGEISGFFYVDANNLAKAYAEVTMHQP